MSKRKQKSAAQKTDKACRRRTKEVLRRKARGQNAVRPASAPSARAEILSIPERAQSLLSRQGAGPKAAGFSGTIRPPQKQSPGRAFAVFASVFALVLLLESGRFTLFLDDFLPNPLLEKGISLVRAAGEASGLAALTERENELVLSLVDKSLIGAKSAVPLSDPAFASSSRYLREDSSASPSDSLPASPSSISSEPSVKLAQSPEPALLTPEPALQDPAQAESAEIPPVSSPLDAFSAGRILDRAQAAAPSFANARASSGRIPETGEASPALPANALPQSPALAARSGSLGKSGAEKDKVVLLVGDSMMGWGLGNVLERSLSRRSGVRTVRDTRPSTGLCSINTFNWQKHLDELITQHSPDLVVICIGANDGNNIVDQTKKRYIVGTASWEAAYQRRATDFLRVAQSRGAKVIWLGLPIAGVEPAGRILRTVSLLQQAACAENGSALFIDNYLTLADSEGRYTTFLNGRDNKPVRVRAKDKIHITMEGGDILAAFVMPTILKALNPPLPLASVK
ncbi:MAG: DUF459 domain-containing protein [Desulfovibrio sp.]|nr:DUF459 domain-containing protein [Desulfovibrio sp.]